jgi:hypothetical protein
MQTRAGAVTSQGDIAQYSDVARTTNGIDGSGITVGVLSDSYNNLLGEAADVSSGDLPAGVDVLSDLASGGCDEGRAMAQIVYDVAPGSELAFHTAFNGAADFALGIEELAGCPPGSALGCTPMPGVAAEVIVDDVGYADQPFFQDGVVAQAADNVAANGVAYFSSAGNSGRNSYESAFRTNGGVPNYHDFDPGPGVDVCQSFSIPVGETAFFILQWDEPFFSVSGAPGASNDIDIFLVDSTCSTAVAGSASNNLGGDAFEFFSYQNLGPGTDFNVVIENYSGADPGLIKYVNWRGGPANEYDTQSSTSFGHPNAAGAIGTGAAPYFLTPPYGTTPPLLESFSSAGGTPILFNTSGAPLPVPLVRNKPDITAPDGGNNTFFGSDFEPDGFPNFFGTSAAAPHAAGAAALLLECDPGLTPNQIRSTLATNAIDMETPGFDFDSGHGLLDAEMAAAAVCGAAVTADKIGVWRSRLFYLDINGNFLWDPPADGVFGFGAPTDLPVIGDWNGDGVDDLGVRRSNLFFLDLNGNRVWDPGTDGIFAFGISSDIPVVGDWNGDGVDDIGVFRSSIRRFYLDSDGSRSWNPALDTTTLFGAVGDTPITGDWNGDGVDEIGVHRPAIRRFYMDSDGSLSWNPALDTTVAFGAVGDAPIIGDWNADGTDEIGVYRQAIKRFYMDTDGNFVWNPALDTSAAFGAVGDTPIIGNW